MLDVNTLPKRYRKVEEFGFDECSQLRSTIEKNRKKEECYFKTNVSSQKSRMRKEEGATVAASHLPSLSWLSRQAGRAAFSMETTLQEAPIKYR